MSVNSPLDVLAILLAGVIGFAVHRASLRNLLGGILMGLGATLIPGGNDALILHGIPGGSPHALPAYAALLIGTAIGLLIIRALVGKVVTIDCTGDICRTDRSGHPRTKFLR